jgi:hypothetical protein
MSEDTEMEPNHAHLEYVPGRGVHVIDKSGGFTYIQVLHQFVDLGWAHLGQSIKIGRTVLKIEKTPTPS